MLMLSINIVRQPRDSHSQARLDQCLLQNRITKILNMKSLITITLLSVIAVAWTKPATYTDKWDHINVDEILESKRLLRGYVDCLVDKGRCTADAKALKETLPDALEHDCSKCTEKQKSSADKVIRHLVNKRPDLWEELAVKYDPKNIYQQKYKTRIEAVKGKA